MRVTAGHLTTGILACLSRRTTVEALHVRRLYLGRRPKFWR